MPLQGRICCPTTWNVVNWLLLFSTSHKVYLSCLAWSYILLMQPPVTISTEFHTLRVSLLVSTMQFFFWYLKFSLKKDVVISSVHPFFHASFHPISCCIQNFQVTFMCCVLVSALRNFQPDESDKILMNRVTMKGENTTLSDWCHEEVQI